MKSPRRIPRAVRESLELLRGTETIASISPVSKRILSSSSKDEFSYKPYTDKYDEIIHASKLITDGSSNNTSHLPLQRLTERQLEIESELYMAAGRLVILATSLSGVVDARRIKPKETSITILIACCGQMKASARKAAVISYSLGEVFDELGINTEILGFTTKSWRNGSKVVAQWREDGCPRPPGRLNDLRHIIFKDSSEAWLTTKANLGLVLNGEDEQSGLFKENIDGEALMWAWRRTAQRDVYRHRMIIIISPECPVDDSTMATNGNNYLSAHLQTVVSKIEHGEDVLLSSINCGVISSRFSDQFYSYSINMQSESTTTKILDKLALSLPKQFDRFRPAIG